MTIEDLQVALNNMIEDGSDMDTEVIIGYQPGYPLAAVAGSVTCDEETGSIVITAGDDIGYGKRAWWDGY